MKRGVFMESFILYSEYLEQIQDLDMLQRGRLLTAILEYAGGSDLETIKAGCDGASFMAFRFIKARMDRDQKSYQEKCEQNRKNVQKRWARKKRDTTVYDRMSRNESNSVESNSEKEDTTVYDRIRPHTTEYDSIHNDNYNDNDLKKSGDKSPRKESTSGSAVSDPEDPAVDLSDDPPTDLIIGYLNARSGKHFRTDTEYIRQLIAARWAEGYRLEDFRKVIDAKVKDWTGTPYAKFIRPATLFSEHFEDYVNQGEERRQERAGIVNYDQRQTDYDGMLAAGVIGG